METQVHLSSPVDFDFNKGRASPCNSSPSTPKGFGDLYFSAPTSPARASEIYREFEGFSFASSYARGTDDFAFATTKSLQPAEKILHSGKINPLKPPPYGGEGVEEPETIKSPLLYPQSPISIKTPRKKSLWSAFSPKRRKESDPFKTAISNTETRTEQGRGRERVSALSTSRSVRRGARSLSPSRVSDEGRSSSSSSKGSRKWRLKDFLLFRSASEGRASDKDPFKKYADLYRRHEVAKGSGSPSSTQGSSIVPVSRRGKVSAHELHYTVNKAMSQDMKKKSFLPYKQGILGRLAINPTVHALAHGFGSLGHSHG